MGQIRRQLEREQGVVKVQVLANILPWQRIAGQFQQAGMVRRQLQFARRTQHALALDATQLADLDQKRFPILTRWQLGADQRHRHLDADPRIGRTAHDVKQFGLTDIHLAHAQAIGVGVLHCLPDLAHDNLGKGRRHGREVFNL